MLDKRSSKLAVILYKKNIGSEWIGVESGEPENFRGRDINVAFTLGLIDNDAKKKEHRLGEVNVSDNSNPFKDLSDEEKLIAEKVPGSPIYYKDYNGGGYAVAIVNEIYEFQYFDDKAMIFLADMVNKGKFLSKQKINKRIDEENIEKLDLSTYGFGTVDIKYLINFNLNNLRILDLRNNLLKIQGVFHLSRGQFRNLESLNLNYNEIGDEGMKYISNGSFRNLLYLYLFHNKISYLGILDLVKDDDFVKKLKLLSLSENPIGDVGILTMTQKFWLKLEILKLNGTGLTNIGIKHIGTAPMPNLKKLFIEDNKIDIKGVINTIKN